MIKYTIKNYKTGDTVKHPKKNRRGFVLGTHGLGWGKVDFIPFDSKFLEGGYISDIVNCRVVLVERHVKWSFPKEKIVYDMLDMLDMSRLNE